MLNTFDTNESFFKQIYSFLWCYMYDINLRLPFKIGNFDKHHL